MIVTMEFVTFWNVTAALSGILLARLVLGRGLAKRYVGFAVMLAVGLLRDMALRTTQYGGHVYELIWATTLPLLLITHCWAVYNCLGRISYEYPRIGRLWFRIVLLSLVIALTLAAASLVLTIDFLMSTPSILRSVFEVFVLTDGVAASTLLISCAFMTLLPPPALRVSLNVRVHATLLGVYMLTYATTGILNIGGVASEYPWTSAVQPLVIICLLYLLWIFGLSAARENSVAWPELEMGTLKRISQYDRALQHLLQNAARQLRNRS